jgi:hypothetical protein
MDFPRCVLTNRVGVQPLELDGSSVSTAIESNIPISRLFFDESTIVKQMADGWIDDQHFGGVFLCQLILVVDARRTKMSYCVDEAESRRYWHASSNHSATKGAQMRKWRKQEVAHPDGIPRGLATRCYAIQSNPIQSNEAKFAPKDTIRTIRNRIRNNVVVKEEQYVTCYVFYS